MPLGTTMPSGAGHARVGSGSMEEFLARLRADLGGGGFQAPTMPGPPVVGRPVNVDPTPATPAPAAPVGGGAPSPGIGLPPGSGGRLPFLPPPLPPPVAAPALPTPPVPVDSAPAPTPAYTPPDRLKGILPEGFVPISQRGSTPAAGANATPKPPSGTSAAFAQIAEKQPSPSPSGPTPNRAAPTGSPTDAKPAGAIGLPAGFVPISQQRAGGAPAPAGGISYGNDARPRPISGGGGITADRAAGGGGDPYTTLRFLAPGVRPGTAQPTPDGGRVNWPAEGLTQQEYDAVNGVLAGNAVGGPFAEAVLQSLIQRGVLTPGTNGSLYSRSGGGLAGAFGGFGGGGGLVGSRT